MKYYRVHDWRHNNIPRRFLRYWTNEIEREAVSFPSYEDANRFPTYSRITIMDDEQLDMAILEARAAVALMPNSRSL